MDCDAQSRPSLCKTATFRWRENLAQIKEYTAREANKAAMSRPFWANVIVDHLHGVPPLNSARRTTLRTTLPKARLVWTRGIGYGAAPHAMLTGMVIIMPRDRGGFSVRHS